MPATLGPYNGLTWNFDDYDASSNPRGLGKGGFREETGLKLLLQSFLADAEIGGRMSSVSSVAIGLGAKTFTPATMRTVTVGQYYQAINSASNWMYGQVSAVTATEITIEAEQVSGTGTLASWTLVPQPPQPDAEVTEFDFERARRNYGASR